MTSIFARLTEQQEMTAEFWQTKRLKDKPEALSNLGRVVKAIEDHFLAYDSMNWEHWINPGSVTFQHKGNSNKVVTIFIDDGNRLAENYELVISDNPIVVGVELAAWQVYERSAMRADFQHRFKYYQNPENGAKKKYLAPNPDHPFDILFFDDTPCEMEVAERDVEAVRLAVMEERLTW